MKYNDNGEYKDIYIKTFDTLPVGSIVEYNGDTIPDGWTEINDYSTSEIKTGKTWIDGKPIYRKVAVFTSYNATNDIPTNNVETIVSLKGFVQRSDYTAIWQPIPSRLNNTGFYTQFNNVSISGSNIQVGIEFGNTLQSTINKIFIIIEYTKTTD